MELLHNSGDIISQRYRILGILGQGGSGTTYLAANLESDEKVALKALSLSRMSDWKMLELFEREAKVLAQLNNPGIPRYIEYFHTDTTEDRGFYIVQQLAEGKSLAALIEDGYRTTEAEVKQIAAKILEILIYLHTQAPPVIHRDIKPQNIIFKNQSEIFLVDFGAVQNTYYTTFMRGSTVVGTYGYMAPEQFRGQAEPATDLYSLGATLLFLLTHRSPADLPNDGLKIDFRVRLEISEVFADWLEKMLEPDVESRFKSAQDALRELQNLNSSAAIVSKKALGLNTVFKIGVAFFAIAGIIGFANYYKWWLLNILGLAPPQNICGNIHTVRSYLDQTNNPNVFVNDLKAPDKNSQPQTSLLSCAVLKRKHDVVLLLLARGADINLKHRDGMTVLHILLESVNNYNSSAYSSRGRLDAWDLQTIEMLKLLIKHGADVNAQDVHGKAPLNIEFPFSYDELYVKIVKELVNNGANVNLKNKIGHSPLHIILKSHYANNPNFIKLVQLVINRGADVNAKDSFGTTPLHMIIMNNFDDTKPIAQLLLDKGADINAKNKDGRTPLALVKQGSYIHNHKAIIKFLKQNGAKE